MPAITREPLTRSKIENAKPKAAAYWMRDATLPGLALRVMSSGAKSYSVLWGRGRAKVIGTHPIMTLTEARETARRVLAEVAQLGAPAAVLEASARPVDTFGEYLRDRYGPHVAATAKAGSQTRALLEKHFGYLADRPLAAIDLAAWDAFKAERLKAGIHPATVNRDLDRLKAALSQAVAWGLLVSNPLAAAKRIKRGIEARVRYLSKVEEKRLRKALEARETRRRAARESGDAWRAARGKERLGALPAYTDHVMPLALLALNTGLRRGELTQLRWTDIDLRAKRLTVRAGYAKSGQTRHVPLNSEALAVLRAWNKQHRGDGPLFAVKTLQKSWAGLVEAAKLEDFHFHDLRHTFASKLVMAGVDLNTVRELLGHADISMTLRYAHLAPEHKAAAVALLTA